MMSRKKYLLVLLTSWMMHLLPAQHAEVYIDNQGVMRWGDSKEEVHGFGVNYTAPFAHAFRSAAKMGFPIKDVIDQDVYHMTRLGFDAYRVHVWDTEISDTLGNLLTNEHLEAFDYMLKEMKEHGFRFLLTPIAFWGDGWPEPDGQSPGFSHKYGKDQCLINEAAIRAQENYLVQFLNHVNPYTGMAYKDDPAIVAFEVSNEPHHRQPADSVTRYIRKMVAAMHSTGCHKPILYNISHGIQLVDAYFDSGIDGGTFQWYPTGLGAGEELEGNLLPNVDRYVIPFAANSAFKTGAKVVYEFDAADVGRSYMYPAMARSFRTAGIQWATQFAYDPTFLAYANTEYNTHYLNLVYTPQKAISLKIAGEVFHEIPLFKDFGEYPQNTRFGNFRVSYQEDLSEMLTAEEFYYSNHTESDPPHPESLKSVAGCSDSKVVQYEGTGAYFLDQIGKGVWRLEVMPDAIWLADPFGRNSPDRKLAEIIWHEWPMSINLPDLGKDFTVAPISNGNVFLPEVHGQTFAIYPGTYLLTKTGKRIKISPDQSWNRTTLGAYSAPATTLTETCVIHKPKEQWTAGVPLPIEVTVAAEQLPDSAWVVIAAGRRMQTYGMKRTGYTFKVEIPGDMIQSGFVQYFVVLQTASGPITYPSAESKLAGDWDFDWDKHYKVSVLDLTDPVYLFDAFTDEDRLSRPWSSRSSYVPLATPGQAEVRTVVEHLYVPDLENPEAVPIYDYSMRYCFRDKVAGRRTVLSGKQQLVIRGHSLTSRACPVQVALITTDGVAYGGMIALGTESGDYVLPVDELKPVPLVTLPRPYPSFLPYYFERASTGNFTLEDIETLQISMGPGLSEAERKEEQGFALESIWLE